MKRYIVCMGKWYYPLGGMNDFYLSTDNLDDAKALADRLEIYQWMNIFDTETKKVIFEIRKK